MFWKQIFVADQERFLIARNGRFRKLLEPGSHRVFVAPGLTLEIERHNILNLVFESVWAGYLIDHRPELVERYFISVETSEAQVATVYVGGELFKVLLPSKRVLFWRGVADVSASVVDILAGPEIETGEPPDFSALSVDETSFELESR